jgi:hypothetical protein
VRFAAIEFQLLCGGGGLVLFCGVCGGGGFLFRYLCRAGLGALLDDAGDVLRACP